MGLNRSVVEECNLDLTKPWDLRDYRNALRDSAFAAGLREDARIFRRQAPITVRVRYYLKKAVRNPRSLMVACLCLLIRVYAQMLDFNVTLAGLLGIFLLVVLSL